MASDRNPLTQTDGETGLAVPDADMSEWAEALVAQARNDGIELTGEGGLLTGLIRQVLQGDERNTTGTRHGDVSCSHRRA